MSMVESDYDFEEERRPLKKRRVAVAAEVAADTGERTALLLGIEQAAQRIPCHHEKRWLDPSLPAVAAIAAEIKAIVVRNPLCPMLTL